MSRESEVADYLRGDATLRGLAPGGIYPRAILPEPEGLTSARLMPKVWAGGGWNATIVVGQGAAVPTGDLQNVTTQHTSMSQRIEVWAYAKDEATIEAILDRVYTLLMGAKIGNAFRATQAGGGVGIMQAPELPPGIKTHHEDYRLVFIRRPVTA